MVEPVAVVGVGAEGNPPIPSGSLERDDYGGINGSSSSSDDSRTSSNSNNINDSRDLPALVGRPEQNLEVFDELTALGSGRTRSQSRGMTISPSCANALLAYAITVEATRTVEEEAVENERAHDSLPDERLEKERDRLENLERRYALLKQREEEHEPD